MTDVVRTQYLVGPLVLSLLGNEASETAHRGVRKLLIDHQDGSGVSRRVDVLLNLDSPPSLLTAPDFDQYH